MFDAHTHLQDPRLRGLLPGLLNAAEAAGICGVCSCATSLADVADTQALPRKWGRLQISRAFGVHPWHARGAATGWVETLETALLADPSACVGEIGVDGIRKEIPPALQRGVFTAQLELAARLQRPVILHGARAWNELTGLLKSFAPRLPGLMLHGFSGSLDILRENLRLGAFISLSGALRNPKNTRARAVASAVPLPQLLVETDAPDLFFNGASPAGDADGKPLNQPANLPLVLHALAQLRNVENEALCHATHANALFFFNHARTP